MKQAGRSLESLHTEFRAALSKRNDGGEEFRTCRNVVRSTPATRLPVPMLSVDAANRRMVVALGERIKQEKRRDDLRRRLYPTPAEQEQDREAKRLRDIRTDLANMRRLAVLDGLFDDGE